MAKPRKTIITCAVTGAIHTPSMSEYLPVTASEIAEAAIGAVQDAGRDDVTIIASYENQTMLKAVKEGKVLAFATEYPVIMGRISVDLAVRALEKKDHEKILLVSPGIVSKENVDKFDVSQIFAPEGFQPVFSAE